MNQTITISLNKKEKERLSRLALHYGMSLPEFSRKILAELSITFPAESFADYKASKKLKQSFARARADWRAGRVYRSL